MNALIYWIANPIWLGGTLCITAVATFEAFFTGLGAWKYIFGLIFIWVSVWAAILSFGVGKWLPTIGAWGRMVVLTFFTATVVIYAIKHGVHGVSGGDFKPSYGVFIALVPVLFFNYVGFELPNAAGDEMKDPQKDVPFTVIRSAFMAVILYGAPILAILLVLPISQVSSLGGFIDAIKTVFTVYGGHVGADARRDDAHGSGQGHRGRHRDRVHLRPHVERRDLDHGRRPRAGRRLLRRRRAADPGHVLEALRHTDRRQRALRDHLEPVHDPRLPADERQHAAVLQRRARPGDLDHDDLVPGDLPRALHPAPQAAERRTARTGCRSATRER